MRPNAFFLTWMILTASCSTILAVESEADFFENRIRPILSGRCLSCHGEKTQEGNLRLDNRESILQGGDSGPAMSMADGEASLILAAVRHQEDVSPMPPDGKLPPHEVADLKQWILSGAHWPAGIEGHSIPADLTSAAGILYAQKTHWSFQPIQKPDIPPSQDANREWTEIDRFITRRLAVQNLEMSPRAGPRKLLRRVYIDLIGIPPTYEEVKRFEQDSSAAAFAKVVDDLLARAQYGERWGRYWLDVARYADTVGYLTAGRDTKYHHGFTYRDYVIRSFNADKPYDQFVLEQLAADQLELADPRDYAAMGFLTTGRRFLNRIDEIIDDRIDVVTRGLLGLTMQCARCHDHKYDPLTAKDYYALYGLFRSCREPAEADLPIVAHAEREEAWKQFHQRLKELEKQEAEIKKTIRESTEESDKEELRKQRKEIEKQIREHKKGEPAKPARAMVLKEGNLFNPYVFLRGNPRQRGEGVDRRLPEVLAFLTETEKFQQGSGRLELAQALVAPENPLTARVIVNRIWQYHVGQGLVATPSDFGYRGEKPSHPELLDYLAATFVEDGWSMKSFHRRILTSYVYQQSALPRTGSRAAQTDPENRLLWRMNSRRLDWESLRDSLLAVSGTLDLTLYGPSVDLIQNPQLTRRSIYAFVDRQVVPEVLRNFDFTNPDSTTGKRPITTVPQQALFMMNSPFVIGQAEKISQSVHQTGQDWTARIHRLFHQIYQRDPSQYELMVALKFLHQEKKGHDSLPESSWQALVQTLLQSNEFTYIY